MKRRDRPLVAEGCPITDADIAEGQRIRACMLRLGYEPLAVHSPWSLATHGPARGKAPMGEGWQRGQPHWRLFGTDPGWSRAGANTGLLLGFPAPCVQAFDLDIDDRATVSAVCLIMERFIPGDALVRTRPGSRRMVLLARCEAGAVKMKIRGSRGGFERLGQGQQVVVAGWHPAGGMVRWQPGRAPWQVPAGDLPLVGEDAVAGLFDALAAGGVLGRKIDRAGANRPAGTGPDPGTAEAVRRHIASNRGLVVDGVRAAIAAAGEAGAFRHDTLVSCAGNLITRRWPAAEAAALLLPMCDEAYGEGSWAEEVDAAVRHAAQRQREWLRLLFQPRRGEGV